MRFGSRGPGEEARAPRIRHRSELTEKRRTGSTG